MAEETEVENVEDEQRETDARGSHLTFELEFLEERRV